MMQIRMMTAQLHSMTGLIFYEACCIRTGMDGLLTSTAISQGCMKPCSTGILFNIAETVSRVSKSTFFQAFNLNPIFDFDWKH